MRRLLSLSSNVSQSYIFVAVLWLQNKSKIPRPPASRIAALLSARARAGPLKLHSAYSSSNYISIKYDESMCICIYDYNSVQVYYYHAWYCQAERHESMKMRKSFFAFACWLHDQLIVSALTSFCEFYPILRFFPFSMCTRAYLFAI